MKFTKEQQKKIFETLKNYGIILVDEDSKWNNIQIIDEDYFIEKLEEALE